MAIPTSLEGIAGLWSGHGQLHMPFQEVEAERLQSYPSTMDVTHHGTYLALTYTWVLASGDQQQGTLLITAGDEGVVTIGWTDSWHQNAAVMLLTGANDETGITTLGSYTYPGYDPFGWEISLRKRGDELELEMVNIDPAGNREWAVRHRYRPA